MSDKKKKKQQNDREQEQQRDVHNDAGPRVRIQWEYKGGHNESRGSGWTAGDDRAEWEDLSGDDD